MTALIRNIVSRNGYSTNNVGLKPAVRTTIEHGIARKQELVSKIARSLRQTGTPSAVRE